MDAQDFYELVRGWFVAKHQLRQQAANQGGEWERGEASMAASVIADLDKLARLKQLDVVSD